MVSLIDKAIGFATEAHVGQKRKIGSLPYIAHPVGVAMILLEMGCDETVVAAGLLHDVVEDTDVTLEEIRREFGDEVADIVKGCTEPPKKKYNWLARKKFMITALRDAPLSVKLVMAADKFHNLSHTLHNARKNNNDVWQSFGKGKSYQAWYYRSVANSIAENVPDMEQFPIFRKLFTTIDALFHGVDPYVPDE
jgi:(p)ppGpp synthase/HD superfamily hydrolase